MAVTVLVGLQRGDEGKGRFVNLEAEYHDDVARFNGGPNAGHTIVLEGGQELALHGLPSGIATPGVMNVIGNGVLVDPLKLVAEINDVEGKGVGVSPENLMISSAAHLILPHHIELDKLREGGNEAQGTTRSGIAQAAAAKAGRDNPRAEWINNEPQELFDAVVDGLISLQAARYSRHLDPLNEREIATQYVDAARELGSFVTDTTLYLLNRLDQGKRILAEGAQAYWLDPDHGMYPFTTSTPTTAGGVSVGLGVPPTAIDRIVGVAKATPSHVGGGPFVTEIEDESFVEVLRGTRGTVDHESGTTTGRDRRMGYFDLPSLRRAVLVNGVQEIILSKLDCVPRYVVGSTHEGRIPICTSYTRKGKELPVAPDSGRKLEESQPNYTFLPAWEGDIQDVRDFTDLPPQARNYVRFIQEIVGVPVTMLGVGPQHDQYIKI